MKHDAIPHTVTFGSSVATAEYEKVNLFNKFFHSVFTQSSFNIPPLDQLPQPQSTLSDITITESDVYEGLISLNPVKAMGIDGIGPKILKHCALAPFKPIHHLFVLSITKHCLPTEWHFHLIAPVYKSGDKSSVKNYRPISLLCIISKVLEKNNIQQNHSSCLQLNLFITIWFQEESFNNAAVTCLFGKYIQVFWLKCTNRCHIFGLQESI